MPGFGKGPIKASPLHLLLGLLGHVSGPSLPQPSCRSKIRIFLHLLGSIEYASVQSYPFSQSFDR